MNHEQDTARTSEVQEQTTNPPAGSVPGAPTLSRRRLLRSALGAAICAAVPASAAVAAALPTGPALKRHELPPHLIPHLERVGTVALRCREACGVPDGKRPTTEQTRLILDLCTDWLRVRTWEQDFSYGGYYGNSRWTVKLPAHLSPTARDEAAVHWLGLALAAGPGWGLDEFTLRPLTRDDPRGRGAFEAWEWDVNLVGQCFSLAWFLDE